MIIDGSDSSNTYLPNMSRVSKTEASLCQSAVIKHKLMGVRVHAWDKRDYVYLAPPWAGGITNSNYTIECIARTLSHEADLRMRSEESRWPRKLYLQMDNATSTNKNRYVFAYLSYLVQEGIFESIDVNFLPVGHTHEDIDQLFSVINRRMRLRDAYTFPQWKEEVFQCFCSQSERISVIEYITGVRDYIKWIEDVAQMAYSGFKSTVHHFQLQKDPQNLPSGVSCRYLQYCYHMYDKDFGYMPYDDPPASWLSGLVTGTPKLDVHCGKWILNVKKVHDSDDEESKDIVEYMDSSGVIADIAKLFSLKSNQADESHMKWWTSAFRATNKDAQTCARFGDYWEYRLPTPDLVNVNCTYRAYDPDEMAECEPIGPPHADLLTFTNLSKKERKSLRKLAEDADRSLTLLQFKEGDFVVFRTEDWFRELGRAQAGMDPKTTDLPFALGKVVPPPRDAEDVIDRPNTRETTQEQTALLSDKNAMPLKDNDAIYVEVYYATRGDPNAVWVRWTHRGHGNRPWILNIERGDIYLVNPQFHKEKKFGRRVLTAKGKQALANVATFPFHYITGEGLVPFEDAMSILDKQKDKVVNKTSKKGHVQTSRKSYVQEQLKRIENTKKRAIALSERERTQDMSSRDIILERTKRSKTSTAALQVTQTAAI
jgi:hypothetical protein